MIAIIDYGTGNIHSVAKALQLFGAKTIVADKAGQIEPCDKIVLPGVGAFDDAMLELQKQGLKAAILKHIKNKKPFLGICLGMQLLFETSSEASRTKGFAMLKGSVERFSENKNIKVPHMGWNQLKIRNKECPLLKGVADGSYVYFCHSYYPKPHDAGISVATTVYGIEFSSIVWQDNIYGVQFHPEKSQALGLKMVENFVKLC